MSFCFAKQTRKLTERAFSQLLARQKHWGESLIWWRSNIWEAWTTQCHLSQALVQESKTHLHIHTVMAMGPRGLLLPYSLCRVKVCALEAGEFGVLVPHTHTSTKGTSQCKDCTATLLTPSLPSISWDAWTLMHHLRQNLTSTCVTLSVFVRHRES